MAYPFALGKGGPLLALVVSHNTYCRPASRSCAPGQKFRLGYPVPISFGGRMSRQRTTTLERIRRANIPRGSTLDAVAKFRVDWQHHRACIRSLGGEHSGGVHYRICPRSICQPVVLQHANRTLQPHDRAYRAGLRCHHERLISRRPRCGLDLAPMLRGSSSLATRS